MKRKPLYILILLIAVVLVFTACGKSQERISSGELGIEHDPKFGGVYLHMSIEDFCDLGFEYGDVVEIKFSNGYTIEKIPFYNGYYVKTNEPLLVAYPGYPYIKVCNNNGDDFYELGDLTEDCTAVVTLVAKGLCKTVQESMSMVYKNDRGSFDSDEVFANFREMSGGDLAAGLFYRAASPCDNRYNRAPYSSALCEAAGIGYVIDLADDEDEVKAFFEDGGLDCPYWKGLYKGKKVLALGLSSNFRSEYFASEIAKALRAVTENPGPYLIHCTEGKDRTGFVCIVVEALAGATLEELERDYMITYDNYYGVNEESNFDAYSAVREIKFADLLCGLCDVYDVDSLTREDLTAAAENYLSFGGMSREEIRALKAFITE